MNNDIIYSNEQETRIVRIGDVIPVIETYVGLKVVEILPVRRRENVDSTFNALRFPDKKPAALWWFAVTFGSPEGERATLVLVALEEQGLRVISLDHPPQIIFYSEALRARAREEASPLTREYLDQLERALTNAHQLWKIANEYAKDIPDLCNDLYLFHAEFRKVGYLLSDTADGGPQGLGLRKVYLPDWDAKFPDQYITGDDELV
jgi:hypothetical protein